jgi:hypothetical protein
MFDTQINCKEVARYFGGDATYNAIENFLRKPKQKALELKKGAGSEVPASPARPKQKKSVTDGMCHPISSTLHFFLSCLL